MFSCYETQEGEAQELEYPGQKARASSKTKRSKTSQNGQDRIYKTDNIRVNIEKKRKTAI